MAEIIIKKDGVVDPNKELADAGIPQDLQFGGQSTLLKQDIVTRRPNILAKDMKCFKFTIGNETKAGFVLEGQPIDKSLPGFAWISQETYFKMMLGVKAYNEKLSKYRSKKRFEHHQSLEAIRTAKTIEDKLKKRN